jgi:hypothetical protein
MRYFFTPYRIASRLNVLHFVGRVVISGLLILPFGLPLLLVPWTVNLSVLVLFKFLFPSILAGLSMFTCSTVLWLKANVAVKDCDELPDQNESTPSKEGLNEGVEMKGNIIQA